MLYTLPKLANDMGFSYQTLRRWITTGRIRGVTTPAKGRWSYLTQAEANAIAEFVTAISACARG